ncbi:MAG: hypothetical protein P8Y05_05900, partial [Deinococcales bacterium]
LRLDRGNSFIDGWALFTCGDLEITGSAGIVDGNVYSGGDLTINRSEAIVKGDAMARGSITFTGSGSITGNAISDDNDEGPSANAITASSNQNLGLVRVGGYAANRLGAPTLFESQVGGGIRHDPAFYDIPEYCEGDLLNALMITEPFDSDAIPYPDGVDDTYAEEWQGDMHTTGSGGLDGYDPGTYHFIDGNATIEGGTFEGEYYVNGDLTVAGNYAGNATFYVKGSLAVQGDTSSTATSTTKPEDSDATNHVYVVNGDTVLQGGSTIDGLIYTNGNITARGNAVVNGGVIAIGTGGVTGSLAVNYRPLSNEVSVPNETLQDYTVRRWRIIAN